MTISTTNINKSYSGNGSTHSFAYDFPIFADADLTVVVRSAAGTETVKTLNTHYIVTGAGASSGGNVLFKFNTGTSSDAHYSATDYRPASGETVVIRSELANTQTLDLVANDPFPASAFETALDKLVRMVQQHDEELDRSIKLSRTNTMTSTEFTTSATDRASKILAFDSAGEISVAQELGTFKGNSPTTTTAAFVQRDIVKSTTTDQLNNIYICVADSAVGDALTDTDHWALLVDAVAAGTSATAAASSASSASTSASTATTKASEASTSAATASTQAGIATAKAVLTAADAVSTAADVVSTNADVVTTNADAATTTADRAQVNTDKGVVAADKATVASDKATVANDKAAAATSASNASTSASTATTKAAEASTSAGNASTSETNSAASAAASASSATAAAASQTAAAASAASAASAFDNFDDTYLGSKTSNPAQDNDGNSLVSGALYFNSTANEMRVYDGANWIAATSAGNVSLILYEYTATSNQTTFSGSDDNSATLSYTVDNLQVVMNGVILDPSDFTATNGTSVVLASGAATGDLVNIYAFKSFTTADMVSKTNGGAFAGNVDFAAGIDVTGNATFADNGKAIFGNSSDLSIYHNGTDSFIDENASGWLYIRANDLVLGKYTGETYVKGEADGAVRLYHNNSEKLTTQSTGADITGVLTADGVSVEGTSQFYNSTAPTLNNDTHAGEALFLKSGGTAGNGNVQAVLAFGKADGSANRSGSAIGSIQTDTDADKIGIGFYTSDGSSSSQTMDERMRLTADGRLLHNTTSTTLDGDVVFKATSNEALTIHNAKGTSGYFNQIAFSNNAGSAAVGSIVRVNDTSVQYNTSSDYRLKTAVTYDWDATTRLKQLKPARFEWIADGDDAVPVDGFLAHEVEAVIPEAITGTKDEVDADGNPVMQGIDQSKIVPLLVKTIIELEARIAALEA